MRRTGTSALPGLLTALFLLATAAAVKADDFTYTTNSDNTLTITGYAGTNNAVIIPSTTNGLTITCIGSNAFTNCTSLTSITIPDTVNCIGERAFYTCSGLTGVTIGNSVTNIGFCALFDCYSLTNVVIPDSVISIGSGAFYNCISLTNLTIGANVTGIADHTFGNCRSLTSVIIPDSVSDIGSLAFVECGLTNVVIGSGVTNIGDCAFFYCFHLQAIYFKGNAPTAINVITSWPVIAYYLPGPTSWGTTFAYCPTALWRPQVSGDSSFGLQCNQFGFNIAWASGMVTVVEACTNLANPVWTSLQTNTLAADSSYFSDPNWTNYPCRFYRIRWQGAAQ